MKLTNYPCWLSKSQLAEADALLAIGFIFCGNADDFCVDGYSVGKIGSWQFLSKFFDLWASTGIEMGFR